MELLNNMNLDNTLIVCPDSFKKTILRQLSADKKLYDVKFMDLNEYKRNWFFDYDTKTIKYLCDKYGFSINNAKEIIDNLYYLEDRKYESDKLNHLLSYKKELDDNNLLIYNNLFKKQIADRKIIVVGYGKLNKEDRNIIAGDVIEYELKDKKYSVDFFEDIEEEVEYLYNSIFDLIYEKNTDINNIYILGYNSDYESYFRRFNSYYPFEIEVKENELLAGTKTAKSFIEMLAKNSREEIYETFKDNDQLINILNRYSEYELREIKDFIINDINNTKIRKKKRNNVIKCVEMFTQFDNDDHVFLIGLNDSVITLKNDTDYISDKQKKELGLSVSEEENELKKENVLSYLSNIDNLRLSYCEKNPFRNYNENNLLKQYEYIKHEKSYQYSDKYNQIAYGYMLDQKERYGTIHNDLSVLNKHYKKNDFGTYNNKFKGLDSKQIEDIDKVSLAYSSMDDFYKCQFAYYLKHILKLNNYVDTFATKLGSFVHEILKEYYENDGFDFEESWQRNIERYQPADDYESFFMNKLKEEIREDIKIIKKQDEDSELKDHIVERRFNHDINDRLSFKGFIDKVAYKDNIVSVIDYKTTNATKINEELMPYGLSMQLPSYMYLLKNDKEFGNDIKYGGFYLQHLINTNLKYDEDKNIEEIKKESMKLNGYTSADLSRAVLNDRTLESGKSENIQSLRLKNDGTFYSNSRVMSDEQIEETIGLVDKKINEAGKEILNANFIINPKQINKKNKSCEYCPYLDICFKTDEDLVIIHTQKEEDDGEVD